MAEDQYAGKGQVGGIWKSEAGKNLTISVLFNPVFLAPKDQFRLNIAISLAIMQFLLPHLGDGLRIKWPNDIYYGEKKLGGILIENSIRGKLWKHAIVGIGLNINQTHFDIYHSKACSLKQLLKQTFDIKLLLTELCHALSHQYALLKQGAIAEQKAAYKRHLYRFQTNSRFTIDGQVVNGSIIDVTDEGRLVVDFGENRVSDFGIKELVFS
ncbi:biotin--[acetyl-CoA-carboxylase] ligase [Olivibacter ginsenosidimutans]|uniref:Biotin--[acetyl-CoA-carboxylase] ligase n=2 Tax=Olivibacter ginsenosidimutans TaxID=1176537 RepID=A0ABP9C3F8_9SPHI